MKVLAVVSGGMDSVTMLHDLVAQNHEARAVELICADYLGK